MPANRISLNVITLLLPLLVSLFQAAQAVELSTLFTTPAERQIINSNRYKSDEVEAQPVVSEEAAETPKQQLFRKEVTHEYKISGITVSRDGPHTVWINAAAYEDGERLEDRSKIKIMAGDEIRVRITTPDGKQHYATSGETLEVTYLAPLEN